jgi:radical SAM protein with 4Fe4S-binding SPASM domain
MHKKILTDDNATPEDVFNETDHYCPLLWCHLHVNTHGNVQPCCMAPFDTSLGNVNNTTFDNIWNGKKMRRARSALLRDKPLTSCTACYEKEKSSSWSLRKASILKYHDTVRENLKNTQVDGTSIDSKPVYWDIRFSNICNMRCRMCGHFSSSKWYADAQKLANEYENYNYLGHKKDRAIINGVEDSTSLLDRLDEYLPHVKELYFAGGEPMLMEEHYRILKRLDELGLHDTFIRYNTNFLQLYYKDKSIVELWKKFTNVFCSISVDTYGKRAEILRKDTVWETIEQNMKLVKQEVPHVRINIAPTIQILNVFTVTDLHQQWCEKGWLGPNDMFLNILHTPDFYCIKALPQHLKEAAKNKLLNHLSWLKENYNDNLYSITNTISNTINFMMSEQLDEQWLHELIKHTAQLDNIRSESTSETFPELKYIWDSYTKD